MTWVVWFGYGIWFVDIAVAITLSIKDVYPAAVDVLWIGVVGLAVSNVALFGWWGGLLWTSPMVVLMLGIGWWEKRRRRRRVQRQQQTQPRMWINGEEIPVVNLGPFSINPAVGPQPLDETAHEKLRALNDVSITLTGTFDPASFPPGFFPTPEQAANLPCRAYGACGATTRDECTCEAPEGDPW